MPHEKEIPPEADLDGSPTLADILERNIRMMMDLRLEEARKRTWQDKIADVITSFSGRMIFLWIHLAWFAVWILLNSSLFGLKPFDPFPYGLLTMLVSLDAIALSILVLISQRRNSLESERRADLALQIGLLTEHELTRVLQMLDVIQDHMDIDNNEDAELPQLEAETHPKDVLEKISRAQKRVMDEADL